MNRTAIPAITFAVIVVFLGIGLTLDPREVPSPLIGKPAPAFTFGHDDDSGPELEILGAGTKAASQIAPTHAVKHQLMSHVPAPPFQPTLQGPQ